MSEFDVVVVGGGPGGSTAATFIAMQGHKVLLLEKEVSPIYKIGESLLPSTIHGICEMLGVSQELKDAKFVRKFGGTFRWGKGNDLWTFAFGQSPEFQSPTSYAYQVERMKFDSILLNNARRKGVEVRERHRVANLLFKEGRACGVEYIDDVGHHHSANCRYIIDASGNSSRFAKHAGEKIYSKFFRNVAIFGYYYNGKRLPAGSAGNIFCAAFDRGWFWYIPLSSTLTSVGAVIGEEHSDILHQAPADALSALIHSCDPIRDLLCEANLVTDGPYGEVRIRRDYSYCHTKFWVPGLVLVGDAACFVDPVFSSGVHLSTYSALVAARSVNTVLSELLSEERAFTEFERRYRREYRYFYDFLVAFYDMDQNVDGYYWAARKVTRSPEIGNEAFIRLVGGIAGSGEPIYSPGEYVEKHRNLSMEVFSELEPLARSGARSARKGEFMARLTVEAARLQLRGTLRDTPLHEKPLFADGLVPSSDGFHWADPK